MTSVPRLLLVAMLAAIAAALSSAPGRAATVTVTVGPGGANSFSPNPVNVNLGDAVHWVWDSSFHSTTSGTACTPDGTWDSGLLNVGATFDRTFSSAGTFPYFCSAHCSLGMTGSVVVSSTVSVTFRTLTATRSARGVLVRWATASELDTLGFNVYRDAGAKRVKLNRSLIGATGGGFYSYLDRKAPRRAAGLGYRLQLVELDGSSSWYGPVSVRRP
jgi:plastocyanin